MPFLLVIVLIFIGWIILLNLIYAIQKTLVKSGLSERRILYFLQFFFYIIAFLVFIFYPVTRYSEYDIMSGDASQAFRINDYYLLLNLPGIFFFSLSTTHPPFRPGRNKDLVPILIQAAILTLLLLLANPRNPLIGVLSNPGLVTYALFVFAFLYLTTGFKMRGRDGNPSITLSILPPLVLMVSFVFVFIRFQLLDLYEFFSHG